MLDNFALLKESIAPVSQRIEKYRSHCICRQPYEIRLPRRQLSCRNRTLTSYSLLLPTPYSYSLLLLFFLIVFLLPTPNFLLPTRYLSTPYSLLLTPFSLLPTLYYYSYSYSYSRLSTLTPTPTPYSLLPTPYSLLSTLYSYSYSRS